MATKAVSSSKLASTRERSVLTVESEHLDQVEAAIRSAGRSLDSQKLAIMLVQNLQAEDAAEPTAPQRVKKYDHRCNYEEGEQVYVDNRYGKSFATITKIIRQPVQAFCDKAFLEFDDADYRARWEEERSTLYFAIHSGRTTVEPVYVDGSAGRKPAGPRMNAAAIVRLAKALDKALAHDPRFQETEEGWQIADASQPAAPARPHISAERGGAPSTNESNGVSRQSSSAALSQGSYKTFVLEAIDRLGEATIDDIKRNIQKNLKLGPADWVTDPTGKIVWLHRLHAAIKHLKRVGAIDSPRREVYRRVVLKRETA